MSVILARDASGTPVVFSAMTMGDGSRSTIHVLADGDGIPYSAAHPVLTAPAILATVPNDCGGVITAANVAQQVMAADKARQGGWITADPNNVGNLYVSLTGTATTSPGPGNQSVLTPGSSMPLSISGYVVQTAVSVAGTVAGDLFAAVEFTGLMIVLPGSGSSDNSAAADLSNPDRSLNPLI